LSSASPSGITVFAPAKINLYLHITGKRDDGFHLLDSLVAFANYGDQIAVAPSDQLKLTIEGPFAEGLSAGADNLVLKAAHLLADFAGVEAKADITLTKNLPIASGIGGGSADAAATLHALTELWGISPSAADLIGVAGELGADVPVCVASVPTFMSGIGEILRPAPALPDCWLVLVNPNEEVSTPKVFAKRQGDFSSVPAFGAIPKNATELAAILATSRNDLTDSASQVAPVVGNVLAALEATKSQLLTRLSGSGATCFALYGTKEAAETAAKELQKSHPDWWIQPAALRS
jgi:4-diphosphocytidyl-2-C-methyl-D-erythritol kinase